MPISLGIGLGLTSQRPVLGGELLLTDEDGNLLTDEDGNLVVVG